MDEAYKVKAGAKAGGTAQAKKKPRGTSKSTPDKPQLFDDEDDENEEGEEVDEKDRDRRHPKGSSSASGLRSELKGLRDELEKRRFRYQIGRAELAAQLGPFRCSFSGQRERSPCKG